MSIGLNAILVNRLDDVGGSCNLRRATAADRNTVGGERSLLPGFDLACLHRFVLDLSLCCKQGVLRLQFHRLGILFGDICLGLGDSVVVAGCED